MLSYTTLQNIIQVARMVIDIAIITLLVYYLLKIVRNNSRTIQIFKGVIFVVLMDAFAQFFGLQTVKVVADVLVQWGFLAIIIIFQPEIRGMLEKLGKSSVFSRMASLSGNERESLVDELVEASMTLAERKVGGLITIEQTQSLSDYVKTGTPMNSIVTADLLTSIFVTTTPLHDGAVIIQGDRIACASAYFLPTNQNLPRRYGARHRAAVGISEITDSITIVISEQTGTVSIARDGELTKMTKSTLRKYLLKVICNEEIEHGKRKLIKEEAKSDRVEAIFNELTAKEEDPIIIEKVDEYDQPEPNETPVDKPADKEKGVLAIFRKKKTDKKTDEVKEQTSEKEPEAIVAPAPETTDTAPVEEVKPAVTEPKEATPKVKKPAKKAPAKKSAAKQSETKKPTPAKKKAAVKKTTKAAADPAVKDIDIDKDFDLKFEGLDDIDIDEVYKGSSDKHDTPEKGGEE